MVDFKKTITTARAKIAKAEIEPFKARLEAIEAILRSFVAAPVPTTTAWCGER